MLVALISVCLLCVVEKTGFLSPSMEASIFASEGQMNISLENVLQLEGRPLPSSLYSFKDISSYCVCMTGVMVLEIDSCHCYVTPHFGWPRLLVLVIPAFLHMDTSCYFPS